MCTCKKAIGKQDAPYKGGVVVAVEGGDTRTLVVVWAVLLLHRPTTGISSFGVSAVAVVASDVCPVLADGVVPSTGSIVPDPFVAQFL